MSQIRIRTFIDHASMATVLLKSPLDWAILILEHKLLVVYNEHTRANERTLRIIVGHGRARTHTQRIVGREQAKQFSRTTPHFCISSHKKRFGRQICFVFTEDESSSKFVLHFERSVGESRNKNAPTIAPGCSSSSPEEIL
jgi:hypothetical protein